MNIHLTPEQEELVKEEIRTGRFRTAEEVITEALQVLSANSREPAQGSGNGAQRNAVQEMLSFVEKNRVRLEGISVKDLIHEGHRL